MRSGLSAPGEVLDRVVRSTARGFRSRGYRVIYWRPGVPNSELDCWFGLDQRDCAFQFAELKFADGCTSEVYLVQYQPVTLTWLSGRSTDWHERRLVLLRSFTHGVPGSVRDVVEAPGLSS